MVPTILSLNEILDEIVQKYLQEAEAKGVMLSLEVECPKGKDFISGDVNQIRRAVDNLVDNALKFTPQGGEVRLKLGTAEGFSRLIIQDTGIGIPMEDMPNIFQRFHRGRNASAYPGSGLGLAIVKATIDQHQAEIEVVSNTDGTTVTVTFPMKI